MKEQGNTHTMKLLVVFCLLALASFSHASIEGAEVEKSMSEEEYNKAGLEYLNELDSAFIDMAKEKVETDGVALIETDEAKKASDTAKPAKAKAKRASKAKAGKAGAKAGKAGKAGAKAAGKKVAGKTAGSASPPASKASDGKFKNAIGQTPPSPAADEKHWTIGTSREKFDNVHHQRDHHMNSVTNQSMDKLHERESHETGEPVPVANPDVVPKEFHESLGFRTGLVDHKPKILNVPGDNAERKSQGFHFGSLNHIDEMIKQEKQIRVDIRDMWTKLSIRHVEQLIKDAEEYEKIAYKALGYPADQMEKNKDEVRNMYTSYDSGPITAITRKWRRGDPKDYLDKKLINLEVDYKLLMHNYNWLLYRNPDPKMKTLSKVLNKLQEARQGLANFLLTPTVGFPVGEGLIARDKPKV